MSAMQEISIPGSFSNEIMIFLSSTNTTGMIQKTGDMEKEYSKNKKGKMNCLFSPLMYCHKHLASFLFVKTLHIFCFLATS